MNGLTSSAVLWSASSNSSEYISNNSSSSKKYRTMTVQFSISYTPGYGMYLDDATDMPYGKTSDAVSAWQEFFGYKPCLFKDGKVVGYLNPNDYSKFEDGTAADITSGNAGDVMVEFPRRGIKIYRMGDVVTLSMTDDPSNSDFTYYAHKRGIKQKNYFYIGAYLGYEQQIQVGSTSYKYCLRSLSGVDPDRGSTLTYYRSIARSLGTGYMEIGFYQFLFIQCMYLLQYKGHLNSQSVHGLGYCNGNSTAKTGLSNKKGVMYGTTSNNTSNDHVKLFGIEDFWGNLYYVLDGCHIRISSKGAFTSNYGIVIKTATDGFNEYSYGYNVNTFGADASGFSGYISNAACSCEVGFIPTSNIDLQGSNANYFCDYCIMEDNIYIMAGGCYTSSSQCGIFLLSKTSASSSNGYDYCGGRLAYL